MTTQATYGLKYEPAKYLSRTLAFASVAHHAKAVAVMLGDDNRFWVVCLADAARLERAGIEFAG